MALKDRLKNVNISTTPKIVEETSFTEFIADALSQKVAAIPVWYDYDYSKQFELILNFLDNKLNSEFEDLSLSELEKKAIAEAFLKNNKGFGILDRILANDKVLSVTVNPLGSVYIETLNGYEKTDIVLTNKQFSDISKRFSQSSAVVKTRQDNLLVTIIKPPVADNVLIIKKINDVLDDLSDLTECGILTSELEAFIRYLINSKKNIILSGKDSDCINYFIQVLLNSISPQNRVSVVEDNYLYNTNLDNISVFSVDTLNNCEYEGLLKTIFSISPDYIIAQIEDYSKLLSYYMHTNNLNNGLITQLRALSISDASNKLVNMATIAMKSTEKLAKLKLSQSYDYIIYVDRQHDNSYILSSIMEVTSSKTSSLVLNEVVKFVEGMYVLDLPEDIQNINLLNNLENDCTSFRSRLK